MVLGPNQAATTNMVSGLMAGVVESVVWTSPTERVKVLQQARRDHYQGNMFKVAAQVVQEDGVSSLFRGVVATSIRQASSVGVRFALYPFVKVMFPESGGTLTNMASGGIVGALSVVINSAFGSPPRDAPDGDTLA